MCREDIRLCQQHNTVYTYTIFKPCDPTVYAQLQTRHFALLLLVIYEILVVRKKSKLDFEVQFRQGERVRV